MKAELLNILVCPLTRTKLRYDKAAEELVSDEAGVAYPIRDGVPVMLVEEARSVPPHAVHGEGDQPQAGGGVDGAAPGERARDG
jgi:hypothetical protein